MFKFFSKMINNKKGFTLVELVVVIAIIGILAAIAVPKMSSMTKTAQEKADVANERMLKNAAALYLAENGNPSSEETWDASTGTADWGKYVEAWPTGFTVKIGTDGKITVTP